MKFNGKRIIMVAAVIALFNTGSAFGSSSAAPVDEPNLSGRASALLNEIQDETAALRLHAETLGTFAWNPQSSWQSHALYLERVKGQINIVGERISELQEIRHAVAPWQQQAIDEMMPHALQVASSTQAAIVHLSENQSRLFVPDYRNHLTAIADGSDNMKVTVDKFIDYAKARTEYEDAQRNFLHMELRLAGS